jgi:8-oxo-dGTP pyrophosphatase MutT (NUDIX family)
VARIPDIEAVAAALALTHDRHPPDATASVMLCLRAGDRGTEVLLCRRATRDGDPWSGHVGLPGGGVDPGDANALATAARETREEVGFDPREHGRVLGMLEPLRPRTFPILIAAYVAQITSPVELKLSDEIAVAWWTPFADLRWISAEVPGAPTRVSAFELPHAEAQDVVLWGITYRLLDRLLHAAECGLPAE